MTFVDDEYYIGPDNQAGQDGNVTGRSYHTYVHIVITVFVLK